MAEGILSRLLAPLGQAIVDPNGAVSNSMLSPQEQARKRAEEEEERRRQLMIQKATEKSAMEAAAATKHVPLSWNPMYALFGDPREGAK